MQVIDHPSGVNLAWETPVPLAAVVAWPVTAAFGPTAGYNAWFVFALILDGWCTYLWLRRHAKSQLGPLLAGSLMMIGPYTAAHGLGHLNLVSFFPIPLIFMYTEELLRGPRANQPVWTGVVIGLLAASQFYLSEELLTLAALAIAASLIALVIFKRRFARVSLRGFFRAGVAAVASAAVLVAPMLAYQFFGRGHIAGLVQARGVYVTDFVNVFIPTGRTWLNLGAVSSAQQTLWTGNDSEQTGYIGLPLIAIAVATVWLLRRNLRVQVVALTAVVMLILSFGPFLHVSGKNTMIPLPEAALALTPVLGNLLPGRLSLVVLFGVVLLLCEAVDALSETSLTKRASRFGLAAVSAATLALPGPFDTSSATTPQYFMHEGAVSAMRAGTVALIIPYVVDGRDDAIPMLWQAWANYRFDMPDGLAISADPSGHAQFVRRGAAFDAFKSIQDEGVIPAETEDERHRLLGELRGNDVSIIIVGPMRRQAEAIAFVSWLLERGPTPVQGVFVWDRVDVSAVARSDPARES